MLRFAFNVKKTTQAAAVLLKNGDIENYLFIKMLYLADRASLERWGESITGDRTVSMPYGPVLSTVYNLTKGQCATIRSFWEQFISDADQETNRVSLKADPGEDELSRAEINILKSIHSKFNSFTWKQIHDFCASLGEYENVGKTSKTLPTERILESLGKSPKEIEEIEKKSRELQIADLLLGR